MRAALVTTPGEPPQPSDHADPSLARGQALVEVTAAPITPLDLLCASGTSYFGVPATPYVPGVQGVGVVRESVAVPHGSRVWFPTTAGMRPGDGSMAQLCAVDDADLVLVPTGVEDVAAGALGLSAVAAWMVLTWRAQLRPGEQVLVLGAGGVVGQVAVQAARLLQAGRVVAACRPGPAHERARAAGADEVVPLDTENVAELATRFAAACEGGFDVVVDPLCGAPASAAARVLGARGRMVNLGGSAGPTATFDSAALRSRSAAILGYTNNDLTREQTASALTAVLEHAAEGRLRADHEVAPLDDVAQAWVRQREGRASGRIVITPS